MTTREKIETVRDMFREGTDPRRLLDEALDELDTTPENEASEEPAPKPKVTAKQVRKR